VSQEVEWNIFIQAIVQHILFNEKIDFRFISITRKSRY